MGEMRNEYIIFVGKPYGRRPIGRIMSEWILQGWEVVVTSYRRFRVTVGR